MYPLPAGAGGEGRSGVRFRFESEMSEQVPAWIQNALGRLVCVCERESARECEIKGERDSLKVLNVLGYVVCVYVCKCGYI